MIKGTKITVYRKTQTNVDAFNTPIYEEYPETIANVLISPAGTNETGGKTDMESGYEEYKMALPKGTDIAGLHNCRVDFFHMTGKVYGRPVLSGPDESIPGSWNAIMRVRVYE